MSTYCIVCKEPATYRMTTNELGWYICNNPECHKNLPEKLLDPENPYISENTIFIEIIMGQKRHKFPNDKRVINSFPNKLKELMAQEKGKEKPAEETNGKLE